MKQFFRTRGGGICAAVLGLMMLIFGVCRGEMSVVLEKAVQICMECIGIG